jgi:2-oxoglutarate dehydrogenase E2 component (dihydrolipoamide succinyltransferase)
MAVAIKVPSVGESITEGVLARWLKKEGEAVKADEPVFELETEKASSEVPAPAAGVLRIKAKEGATVAIGAVVGEIDTTATPAKQAAPTPSTPKKEPPAVKPKPESDGAAAPPSSAQRVAVEAGEASSAARGAGRLVVKEDVQRAAQERTALAKPAASGKPQAERETRQRMSAIRVRIAERLLASQQSTASLTTFNEADLSAVMDIRRRYREKFVQLHGVGLGFMSFFVKACVEALKAYPLVNSRIDGEDIVTCNYWNIGVAVSTEKGLMVPVLKDADQLSFAEIEKQIAELAGKARDGKINVADLQGGTFTITNGGIFGSLLSTPILNPPQSAILGMHTIQERPVAHDGQVVVRPMMYLALTYDHRLIDGREAVLFLVRVKECLEHPERMLLEI